MSPNPSGRPIRSFVLRASRATDSQRKALEQHWDTHLIPFEAGPLDLKKHFTESRPLTVEIGFGMGDSLLKMAQADPQSNFLGIEVHRPGIGKLLNGIAQNDLQNLKIMCHDATEIIANCFNLQSIERLLIFFPDPWPKKRHHKRRIIQAEFVELLATRLAEGGLLHLATDWEAYALHMMKVLENEPSLINCSGAGNYCDMPARPETKFEQRGRRLGHGVWDLVFEKASFQPKTKTDAHAP